MLSLLYPHDCYDEETTSYSVNTLHCTSKSNRNGHKLFSKPKILWYDCLCSVTATKVRNPDKWLQLHKYHGAISTQSLIPSRANTCQMPILNRTQLFIEARNIMASDKVTLMFLMKWIPIWWTLCYLDIGDRYNTEIPFEKSSFPCSMAVRGIFTIMEMTIVILYDGICDFDYIVIEILNGRLYQASRRKIA